MKKLLYLVLVIIVLSTSFVFAQVGDGSIDGERGNGNYSESQIIVSSKDVDRVYYVDEGESTRIVVNFNSAGSNKIKEGTQRNLNKFVYVVSGSNYTMAVKVEKVVSNGVATVYLPSQYRNIWTKSAVESVNKKVLEAFIIEDPSRQPSSGETIIMTENDYDISQKNKDSSIDDPSTQIRNAKAITEYSDDTTIGQMDSVTFGSNDGNPIEWIVLEKNGDKALLLSRLIIENEVYDTSLTVSYSNSYIRNFVNTTMYNKYFNEKEKGMILDTTIDNATNKMFILCKDEVLKYFGNKLKDNKKATTHITEQLKKTRTNITIANKPGAWYDGNSSYWLRDTVGNGNAMYLGYSGRLNLDGDIITINDGIRPAVWVKYK